MKKYALLMSHDNYLYCRMKFTLEDINTFLFHESEIDKFLYLCSAVLEDEILIFFDEQFSKITSAIFHDRAYRFINVLPLKKMVLDDLIEISEACLSRVS